MIVFEALQEASSDVASLQDYLSENFEQVYDFFSRQKHSELVASRAVLYRYIQLNRNVILQLNIADKSNLAFVSFLLDISEELGLLAPFKYLYDHLIEQGYNIGQRLNAASLYLIGVEGADDYLNRYGRICENLQHSADIEEDNTDRVLMTMVNYYAQVIHDFGQFNIAAAEELKSKIQKSISESEYSFLRGQLLVDVLSVDLRSFDEAYFEIHSLLDRFLGREVIKPTYKKEFLLEAGTEYCDLLVGVANRFEPVRQISVRKYHSIKSDSVFNSLGRGVMILTEEIQLYAYMHSYGNMHYEKLLEAFLSIPEEMFAKETNVVDWGCGQAMASMTYFDFLHKIGATQTIESLTLIEPSEIALRRAALHVKHFSSVADIHTVNKDLDALESEDFVKRKTRNHVHLFSNILDIGEFSLTNLLRLVESNFPGENYFICVSPYINDTRTSRLDAFVRYYSKMKGFAMINSVDNRSGQWKGNWTRVVRIFKVNL